MNIYKKLQTARCKLQAMELKKSGNNKFAGYTYMELSDFLPAVNSICEEVGICGVINFDEIATLTLINIDQPEERVIFTSPMSTAELKGCHAIQNLGAVQTYLRRYLWLVCFEICEHDILDNTHGKDDAKTQQQKPATSTATSTATSGSLTAEQSKYFPRIKAALDSMYGDDTDKKKTLIRRLTTFTNKEGKQIDGIDDYRKKDGKGLQILCTQIEKQAADLAAIPSICNVCREDPCVCDDIPY